MRCPVCHIELSQMTIANLTVDVCRDGCGGIWFDIYEITRVDEPHEKAGAALEAIKGRALAEPADENIVLPCPNQRCAGTALRRHYHSVKKNAHVHECPSCGGVWLDAGELKKLRSEYLSEQERKEAASRWVDATFGPYFQLITNEARWRASFSRIISSLIKDSFFPARIVLGDERSKDDASSPKI